MYKACLSPDGKHLLTLSTESKLCLYQVPSLNRLQTWSLDQQPCSDKLSPGLEEHPRKSKYLRDTPFYYHLLDVEWWSDKVFCLLMSIVHYKITNINVNAVHVNAILLYFMLSTTAFISNWDSFSTYMHQ